MIKQLVPIRLSSLTYLESAQLINRHLIDIATLDQTKLTDASLLAYLTNVTAKGAAFSKALLPIRKSDTTDKIEAADNERDTAIAALGKAINLYSTSDVAAEKEATNGLQIVFNTYHHLAAFNYEAETLGIDKLVAELQGSKYAPAITLLNLARYITRLTTANAQFKSLFGGRVIATTASEDFDSKLLRKDLFVEYTDFTDYVLSQAKAPSTKNDLQFTDVLNILNTARKYYADLLAKRK